MRGTWRAPRSSGIGPAGAIGRGRPWRPSASRPTTRWSVSTASPRSYNPRWQALQELVGPFEDAQHDTAVGRPGLMHRARPPPDEIPGGARAILVHQRAFEHIALLDPHVPVAE